MSDPHNPELGPANSVQRPTGNPLPGAREIVFNTRALPPQDPWAIIEEGSKLRPLEVTQRMAAEATGEIKQK